MNWLRNLVGAGVRGRARDETDPEEQLRTAGDREWAGDAAGAERLYRAIIEADPGHAEAHYFLSRIALLDRRHGEAAALLEKAVALQPEEALYRLALGDVLMGMREYAQAVAEYRVCVSLQPGCSDMQVNFAAALIELNRREEARIELERLRELLPDYWQVHFNLGGIYREYGRIEDAVACYRRCLELEPGHAPSRSNLLLTMNYSGAFSPEALFHEHCRYGERFARVAVPPAPDRRWPRRLRIGYLSPDLRGHVITYFLEPLLANHDHQAFEILCYHSHPEKDAVTERLRGYADHWIDCEDLSDAAIAERIRADRIDILVDLAGHTGENRLGVLALKPAPVQATWLGYPNTTGLRTVDYQITDARADPPGEADAYGTERKARLSGSYFCYRPAPLPPDPGPFPARGEGTVTFGCFNNFPKVSAEFVAAAARILLAVPGSRLVMKSRALSIRAVMEGLQRSFAALGVDGGRLDLRGWESGYRDHLSIYREVDIALDTFPYNGATTTCEALWMGVPVVTVAGDRHAGRMGSSLLCAVGLEELVATDVDGYVARCAELAMDRERLGALRRGLRERMRRSPLMAEGDYARRFEALLREMWQAAISPRPANAAPGPVSAEEWVRQARVFQAEGRHDQADAAARRALAANPVDAQALQLLCQIAFDSGSPGAALEPLLRALEADAGIAVLHYLLGCVLQEQDRLADAEAALRRALALDPGLAKARNNLGCLLEASGRLEEAIGCFEQAARLDPSLAQAHYNLANAHKRRGDAAQALAGLARAIALEPSHPDWLCNLANLQYDRLDLDEAESNLRRAIAADPGYAPAQVSLAVVLLGTGRVEEALAAYDAALALGRDPATESSKLLALHYRDGERGSALAQAHAAWYERHAAGEARMTQHTRRTRPGRRLNIGYVSPDFRRHPVAHFIEPVLAAHDRSAFRVFCYSSGDLPDAVTDRLRGKSDFWRDIGPLPDPIVADRVRADGIDILVDLAGHTAGGRLLLFARKPAPVQVSWLGYPGTTGLRTMDYRITDAVADPPDMDASGYAEQLVRLPNGFLCYAPPADAPDVGPLPALRSGRVTFGCFNNLPKVTPDMVALWSELLRALPGARLLLKSWGLAAASARRRLRGLFAMHGIAAERLELLAAEANPAAHLARYAEVDVALDVFPYNGVTTSCEALWMGVPVVTLAGTTHVARAGASLLQAAGLPMLIARSPSEYVAKACALVGDTRELGALRAGMRARLRDSALLDAPGFTRALEDAYRRMAQDAGLAGGVRAGR